MIEQGSKEWLIQRLGCATASQFSRVMGGPAAWTSYAKQIREERKLLERINSDEDVEIPNGYTNNAMAWGNKYESHARAEFEFRNDVDVNVPSFVKHPNIPWCGCSPDGLVGTVEDPEWFIEIKCPFNESVHMETLANGIPKQHKPQIQGQHMICGLQMGTFITFDPRRERGRRYKEFTTVLDEEYAATLTSRIVKFLEFVESGDEVPSSHPQQNQTGDVPVLF